MAVYLYARREGESLFAAIPSTLGVEGGLESWEHEAGYSTVHSSFDASGSCGAITGTWLPDVVENKPCSDSVRGDFVRTDFLRK